MSSIFAPATNVIFSRGLAMATAAGKKTLPSTARLLLGGGSTVLAVAQTVSCDDGKNGKDIMASFQKMINGSVNEGADEIATAVGSQVSDLIATGVPTHLTYGFACGFCAGYAFKIVGRAAAAVVGLGFCAIQGLSYAGYITVDHNRIQHDAMSLLDLNDDGVVDSKDSSQALQKLMDVLKYNMPAGGGFVGGFYGGFRSG